MMMAHVGRTVCLVLIYRMHQAKMHQDTIKSTESVGKSINPSNFTSHRWFLIPKKQSTIENRVLISLVVVTIIFLLYAIIIQTLAGKINSRILKYNLTHLSSNRMYNLTLFRIFFSHSFQQSC